MARGVRVRTQKEMLLQRLAQRADMHTSPCLALSPAGQAQVAALREKDVL